jgi:hypothetical protein
MYSQCLRPKIPLAMVHHRIARVNDTRAVPRLLAVVSLDNGGVAPR